MFTIEWLLQKTQLDAVTDEQTDGAVFQRSITMWKVNY